MVKKNEKRSLNDKGREIERCVEDAHYKKLTMQHNREQQAAEPRPKIVKKGSMLSNDALSPRNTDIDVETIKARTKKQTGGDIAINAKAETEGMLKKCHVIRGRNVSVQPTRARIAELRSLEHNEETKSVFGNNPMGNTMGSSRFEYSSIISRNTKTVKPIG